MAKCVALASQAHSIIGQSHDEPCQDQTLLEQPQPPEVCRPTHDEIAKLWRSDRIIEGMRRATAAGKHLGRPTAASRPKVIRLLPAVRAEIETGTLSRRQAAKRLGVGAATLNRLLAAA
jgi:hypothetical protein